MGLSMAVVATNLATLRGEGPIGRKLTLAISRTLPYGGHYRVEALIEPSSGEIVDILLPDPTRRYTITVVKNDGMQMSVPAVFSADFPHAKLSVLHLDASNQHQIVDVSCWEFISADAWSVLKTTCKESQTPDLLAA